MKVDDDTVMGEVNCKRGREGVSERRYDTYKVGKMVREVETKIKMKNKANDCHRDGGKINVYVESLTPLTAGAQQQRRSPSVKCSHMF